MNYLTGALLTATLFTASLVHAELKYIAYDLDSKTAETVTVTEADLRSDTYRTGSKMLFVQDTDVSDEYYIGVFEVTQAQAAKLNQAQPEKLDWPNAIATSGVAYAMTSYEVANFSPSFSAFPSLSFPRVDQWQAYADETDAGKTGAVDKRDNLRWSGDWPFSLTSWYTFSSDTDEEEAYEKASAEDGTFISIEIAQNKHGVFDIFGNVAEYTVAEYTTDAGKFYGGYASARLDPPVTKGTCHEADSAIGDSEEKAKPNYGAIFGARLIYTPPEEVRYSFTVTLNGETKTEDNYKAETTVTVPVPDFPDGHRETSKTVEPTDLVIAENNTFTMPAANVTITYTTAPYLTIQVKGGTIDGTATKLEVIQGENTTFTLRPTLAAFQVFESWTLPDGTTTDTRELTINADELFTENDAGDMLTYTVNTSTVFGSYPRVLVYNGTVTYDATTGEAYGEGYYKPGTVLTITAPEIAGATFSTWQKDGVADETLDNPFTYPVEDTTDDTTFSPVYTFDTPTENAAVTYIGETGDSPESYTAKVELGYKAVSGSTEHAIGVNKFHYYATAYEESDYLVLDIANKAFTYANGEPTTSQTTTPTLKRVVAETVQSTPYYVGLYETTVAHVANLAKAVDPKSSSTNLSNTNPQTCSAMESWENMTFVTYFANINTIFGLTATLPTIAQVVGINSDYSIGPPYTNTPHPVETSIKTEHIYNQNTTASATVAERKDDNGFYDILGNTLDMFLVPPGDKTGKLRGGNYKSKLTQCNLDLEVETFPNGSSSLSGAFRPVISVREKYEVTIEGLTLETPLTVLPGQVINLAPQVAEGKTFVGWTATKEGETEAVTISKAADADVYPYTVESHVTLTPVFTDKTITLTYSETCRGPETALPGSSTQIYATNPGHALTDITLDPADAGTVDLTTGTITFEEGATGAVTVTATYADSSKPGYILKLK